MKVFVKKKIKEGDSGLYGLQKCSKIHHLSHGLEESQPRPDMLINQSDVVIFDARKYQVRCIFAPKKYRYLIFLIIKIH